MKRWTIFLVVCVIANAICIVWDLTTDSYLVAAVNTFAMITTALAASDAYRKGQ